MYYNPWLEHLQKEFTFRKANQAFTLCSRSTVKIKGEPVNADPQLLFQRLISAGERCEDVRPLFRYELCTYPATLFKSSSPVAAAHKEVGVYLSITSGRL